jgi:hypothetical protein
MSAYSSSSRHSGHLISVQSLLLKSDSIDSCIQSRHVFEACVHVAVIEKRGKTPTSLVSAQTTHSRALTAVLLGIRWCVTITSDESEAFWYRCPNLEDKLLACV